MKADRIREVWDRGEVVLDAWASGDSMLNAETLGRAGFHSVLIDMQHSMTDFVGAARCIVALGNTPAAALVRVPQNDWSIIQRLLDAGADGVMIPMCNTPEEARRFVNAVRYPPEGERSYGLLRSTIPQDEYNGTANSRIVTFVQIETPEAMENLDAIASTDGVDVIFHGPADLNARFGGKPIMDYSDQSTLDRHAQMRDAAHRAGKKFGMLVPGADYVEAAVELGADFMSIAYERGLVIAGASAALAHAHGLTGTTNTAPKRPTGSPYA
ncbi:HpcH/HpaI aldolase family protein [Herbiconiux sp. P16]|uniref:HpcH/HpaI aldolase family protein n=1 Tax=Herbiconiux wuyangfengii TaxID=3342794 RepID=UPI0035B887DC